MYKIFKQDGNSEDNWIFVEDSNVELSKTLQRVLKLEEENPNTVYRVEQITETGNTIINFI